MPPTIGETKKQKSSVMPLFAVLLFGATFVAGYKVGTMKGVQGDSGYDAGYAAGIAATSESLRAAGLLPETRPTMTVTGTVTSIDGSAMVIEVPQVVLNPLDVQAPTTRTVRISESTSYVELMPKSPQEMQKEIDDAGKKSDDPGAPPQIIDPFSKKPLKLSDIAVGSTVSVTAANDILRAEAFDAVEVRLVLRPAPQLETAPTIPDGAAAPGAAVAPPLMPPPVAPPSAKP